MPPMRETKNAKPLRINVFISHISEEAELAGILQQHLKKAFLGIVDSFVSSDSSSIRPGQQWLNRIDVALNKTNIVLVLCSKESITEPWISFEAGAGWLKKIDVSSNMPFWVTGRRFARSPPRV